MSLSRRALLVGSASVAALGGLAWSRAALAADTADLIIFGGAIVTMNDAEPTAEAVAVKDGKIAALGAVDDIRAEWAGPGTRLIDLGGKALLPGFIDGHGHFMNAPRIVNWANVSLPPVGPVNSIPDIVKALQENMAQLKLAKGAWVMGYGYDATGLAEKREMTRDDLDPYLPRQSGDGDPRLQPRGGAQLAGAEDLQHHRRHADPGGRPDRPRARLEPAGRPPHGDRLHADLRQGAAAGRGRDARPPQAGAADLREQGRHHGAGGRHPCRRAQLPPQGRRRGPPHPRHRLAALHRRGAQDLRGLHKHRQRRQAGRHRRPLGRVRQLQGPRQARRHKTRPRRLAPGQDRLSGPSRS